MWYGKIVVAFRYLHNYSEEDRMKTFLFQHYVQKKKIIAVREYRKYRMQNTTDEAECSVMSHKGRPDKLCLLWKMPLNTTRKMSK